MMVITVTFDIICLFFLLCAIFFIFKKPLYVGKISGIIMCLGIGFTFLLFGNAYLADYNIQQLLAVLYGAWLILCAIYFIFKKPKLLKRWQVIPLCLICAFACAFICYYYN